MGTAGYMSPEQAQGKVKEIDQRSDIFSFGCILFEAVTGHKPFEGQDLLDSLHKIVHAPTPQIKETNANAPLTAAYVPCCWPDQTSAIKRSRSRSG